jgi:hypothetical protein
MYQRQLIMGFGSTFPDLTVGNAACNCFIRQNIYAQDLGDQNGKRLWKTNQHAALHYVFQMMSIGTYLAQIGKLALGQNEKGAFSRGKRPAKASSFLESQ